MKIEICAEKINVEVKPISGHVYRYRSEPELYFCASLVRDPYPAHYRLFSLITGTKFSEGAPFGADPAQWRDVTDEVKVVMDK